MQQWFKDPTIALKKQGYTNKNSKKATPENLHWKPIALHAFSRLVDDYLNELGIESTTPNKKNPFQKDRLIIIPGCMEYPDGTKNSGIFVYIIDRQTGECYHRMFEPQSSQKMISTFLKDGCFAPVETLENNSSLK